MTQPQLSKLRPYLTDMPQARGQDVLLYAELFARNRHSPAHAAGMNFLNEAVARHVKTKYSTADIAKLEDFLRAKGTLHVPIIRGHHITVDGLPRPVALVGATEQTADGANHGEMSSMIYLRDHIQTARALLELYLHDAQTYQQEGVLGRELLLSALHCMSSPAQLARFDDGIRRGRKLTQEQWPHISLWFDDLDCVRPNGWRNKQDSFQMLAHLAFDMLARGFLHADDLLDAHKQFLGSVIPFLRAVGFPNHESSGSWEELATIRTSVMAVETAILVRVQSLIDMHQVPAFLFDYYERAEQQAPHGTAFAVCVQQMLNAGLSEIGRRLPNESPDYDRRTVLYREADAALAYVLMYDLPAALARAKIPVGEHAQPLTERQLEVLMLAQLQTLRDPTTNGIIRYKHDSYQGVNFHTHEGQLYIRAIKAFVKADAAAQKREINLIDKQSLRGQAIASGYEPAWNHPLGQLSSWAALRSMQVADPVEAAHYRGLATEFLNRMLANMTGEQQWNAVLQADGGYRVQPVTAFRLPECQLAYRNSDDQLLLVPSPHTPLNWSSIMLKQSLGLLRIAAQNTD